MVSQYSCSPSNNNGDKLSKTSTRYTSNLLLQEHPAGVVVTIKEPFKNAGKQRRYLLIKDTTVTHDPAQFDATLFIPIGSMVATATSQAGFLSMLDSGRSLSAFCSTDFISSPTLRKRIELGQISELGPDSNLDLERLLEVAPEVVVAYSVTGEVDQWQTISRLGIPVLYDASFLETTPLAQAEWIKLFGLLTGRESAADSIFDQIATNYEALLQQVERLDSGPEVMAGSMYGGTWYMPGGNSWVAAFIKDAGGRYQWAEMEEAGSVPLSFEAVYDRSSGADIWIGATVFSSYEQLINEDTRYLEFSAVANGAIFSPTRRTTTLGGNDYYESGIARPDLVLKDFVAMLQPDILPGYQLFYYQKLPHSRGPI